MCSALLPHKGAEIKTVRQALLGSQGPTYDNTLIAIGMEVRGSRTSNFIEPVYYTVSPPRISRSFE